MLLPYCSIKAVPLSRNIYKIYFKAKNYKKTQSVGNSDELLPMAKATQLNITSFAIRGYVVDKKRFEKYRIIQDRLFQSDFDKYQTDNLLDFDNEIES